MVTETTELGALHTCSDESYTFVLSLKLRDKESLRYWSYHCNHAI